MPPHEDYSEVSSWISEVTGAKWVGLDIGLDKQYVFDEQYICIYTHTHRYLCNYMYIYNYIFLDTSTTCYLMGEFRMII